MSFSAWRPGGSCAAPISIAIRPVRDLFLVGFIGLLGLFGLKRPFLFVLAYVYVDIVSPQRLSYFLLNSLPVSLIFGALAFAGWAAVDDKAGTRLSGRQMLLLLLLGWAGFTTLHADFPAEALTKWGWVWKSLVWAIFLPFTLRTRARIEALGLFMTLSAASIIIVGGVKTLASGGGYGSLALPVIDNSGLYEGSILSTVAIAIIPLILWLMRFGTVFPSDWRVKLFGAALIFACLLIPVGTEARTGLVCIALLVVLMLRAVKRRMLYLALLGIAGTIAVPLLPHSFTQRMDTIQGYQADNSASTRLAVWKWTWDYVQDHPLGGGFEAYRQNKLTIDLTKQTKDANTETVTKTQAFDEGRAFHSSYFEMLGEQGFPGLALWLLLHATGLIKMEGLRRRYRKAAAPHDWIAPLATALQHGHLIYLTGSLFVGIAFQPFVYMMVAIEIGLGGLIRRREGARPPLAAVLQPKAA